MKRRIMCIVLAIVSLHVCSWGNMFEWYPGGTWFQAAAPPLVLTLVQQELSEKQKKTSLSYPNPIYLSAGNQQPTLFYWLEKDEDIVIYIYNSIGMNLGTKHILRGTEGGKGLHMNEVMLGPGEFNLYHLTPGVYFYIIYTNNKNKCLYTGKIGVQP